MAETTDSAGARQGDAFSDTGELLRRAREAQGLTIQQVAQSLHLDAWILEALEANRFKDIGAPVFVKGHLRKFAAEVGVSQEAVMEAYYRAEDTPDTPMLVTDTLTRPAGGGRGRGAVIALSIMLVALIALVVWLWLRGPGLLAPWFDSASQTTPVTPGEPFVSQADSAVAMDDPAAVTQGPAGPANSGGTEAADGAGTNSGDPIRLDDSAASGSVSAPATTPVAPEEVSSDALPEGMIRLSISVANDSWVEIYDGNNRRLFFDLGKAGTRRTVTGSPPLQVLLGNAEGAEVILNGAPYEIPAGTRRGKTARFTVQ